MQRRNSAISGRTDKEQQRKDSVAIQAAIDRPPPPSSSANQSSSSAKPQPPPPRPVSARPSALLSAGFASIAEEGKGGNDDSDSDSDSGPVRGPVRRVSEARYAKPLHKFTT